MATEMQDVDQAFAAQASSNTDSTSTVVLPSLMLDGFPTPLDKMTCVQLKKFIGEMMNYLNGYSKPCWGNVEYRPVWWPKSVPWVSIETDERTEEEKMSVSWTEALRAVVKNCYEHYGRTDLLNLFDEGGSGTGLETKSAFIGNKRNPEITRMLNSPNLIRQTTPSGSSRSGILQGVHTMTNQNKIKEKDATSESETIDSCSDTDSSDTDSSEGETHTKSMKNLVQCGYCDYVCKDEGKSLRNHEAKHTKIFRCIICNYTTDMRSYLSRHTQKHVGNKCYICDICGYSAVSLKYLKSHISSHVRLDVYTCDVCGFSTHNKSILNGHMKRHSDERPFHCEFCGFNTKFRSDLRKHLLTHTANGRKRKTCEICQKTYAESHYYRHIASHGERKYKCSICSYASHNKYKLATHIKIHTGEKNHKCTYCGYASNWRSALARHLRIHTGERKYKCDICGYAFNQRSALNRHMRTHSDEKLLKCSHCDYSCHQNSQLKLHYIRRHKELNEK